ncbi:MFS transporter [Sulfitobacter sp. HNIBRBA3233]|uniref:MFS transporter n=1 Tax=Sulfitobacter marinivivus TaxID=3158558 RepID=UPI0032DEBD7E
MDLTRNIATLPWYRFCDSLLFWQAMWFLYFQQSLSGAEAIVLYAVYDISVTVLEVPSGYFSDRLGRKPTLLLSALCGMLGCLTLALGGSFLAFAAGQALIGAAAAFRSGTDSSLMYESLDAAGRAGEIEAQEVRLLRYSLAGFALSAFAGGVLALWMPVLPFYATALAFAAALFLAARLVEPPKAVRGRDATLAGLRSLRRSFGNPVLQWLFALAVVMYGFSHLPFVFGQPFIREALDGIGLAAEAPLVSGGVSSVMMLVSVAVSLVALSVRKTIGLPATLLVAFAMQIALVGALTLSTAVVVIAVLVLRMVPDALASPFIVARIQPLLSGDSRATYLSLQSLAGKLLFSSTLLFAASGAQSAGLLPAEDLQRILGWYALAGLGCLVALGLAARSVPVEDSLR